VPVGAELYIPSYHWDVLVAVAVAMTEDPSLSVEQFTPTRRRRVVPVT
jgi:hypothetical protein